MTQVLSRLWRIPLGYAFVVALPLQILVGWIVLQGFQSHEKLTGRQSVLWGESPPFHHEQWRYFARDAFREDVADLFAPRVPADDGLESFSLSVSGNSLASLNADLPTSGQLSGYYPGLLEADDARMLVKVRYTGDDHWHWLFAQKSWRVKTEAGDAFRDRRAFNLENPPSRLVIDDTIIHRLSREHGLLAPEVEPVKLLQNGTYGGLYLRRDLADESLLRRERRMPGSVYQGDNGPPDEDGVSALFRDPQHWDKTSSRNTEQAANRTDIEALIAAINSDPLTFREFAIRHLDLDAYATFIAIDRLFAGRHHDYHHNHRIYFDPLKGRFEPIQWGFGDWGPGDQGNGYDQKSFDGTESPLLSALKQHPEFELRLQRKLHELANRLTPDELGRRLDELVADILPALRADTHRDHRDLLAQRELQLPIAPCVYYGIDEFLAEAETRKHDFAMLHRGVLRALSASHSEYRYTPGEIEQLEIASHGHAAQTWVGMTVQGEGTLEVFQDRNRNGELDPTDPRIASQSLASASTSVVLHETLYPGLKQVPSSSPTPRLHGLFELTPAPLRYRYFLRCDGRIDAIAALQMQNSVTGEDADAQRVDTLPPAVANHSVHPWESPQLPAATAIRFGPGTVEFTATRRFGPATDITFAPGTTVKLGADVSLLFYGKVTAVGTAEALVTFEPLDRGEPWGVMLLHGQGTAGSRLSHCRWRDGSVAAHDLMARSGMVSVIDTRDIVLEHSDIGRNHFGDDAMHWGYVNQGVIRDCRFDGARGDALDIDICRGLVISRCEFMNSGKDCLDLMASRVEVRGCRFRNGGASGLSVGGGSNLGIADSRFVDCVIGIEIQDNSVARLDGSTVIDGCGTGIALNRKSTRYSRGGTLQADALNIQNSKVKAVEHDSLSTVPADLAAILQTRSGS